MTGEYVAVRVWVTVRLGGHGRIFTYARRANCARQWLTCAPGDTGESLSLIDLRVLNRMQPVPDDSLLAAQTSSADRSAA